MIKKTFVIISTKITVLGKIKKKINTSAGIFRSYI
jgi:hypothetical protein